MKIKLLVLCFIISSASYAQIAFKAIKLSPKGEFGFIMNKKITGELMKLSEFNGKFRSRFGLAYIPFQPRLDTFPVYAFEQSARGDKVIPGSMVFHKYNMTYFFGGADFRFTEDKKFSPYIGTDIIAGVIVVDYDAEYESLSKESVRGDGGVMGGFRFRVGAQYEITDNIGAFLDFCAAGYVVNNIGVQAHQDYGIGVYYIFNP